MKTIKDFTPEIQAKIPEYIEKYTKGIFDGGRYNNFKKENDEELINWNYEQCGYKKPVVIVAENPLESQIFFNYIKSNSEVFLPLIYINYCLINNIELPKELDTIENKDSKLDSQLHSQLYSQLRSQLHSQLRSQLRSQLDSQLHSQLYSQLRSQLDSQLHSQLYSQLHSQLDSQLRSQLDSQLDSQLHSQLHSQLRSQLRSQLHSQLYSQLRSQLDSQLRSQLRSQLHSQLSEYNSDYLFTTNIYSNSLLAWWKFIKDEFKLDSEIGVTLDSWNNLYEKSGVYSAIFSELICVVSKYPKKILRDSENNLHSINSTSVNWGYSTELTKFNCYYLNGRNVPEWVFEEYNNETYFEKFIKEDNEDIKAAVITLIKEREGNDGLLNFLKAELIDEKNINHFEGYTETLRLYKTKDKYSFLQDRFGKMNQPYCWSEMKCPSTGSTYLIDNSADFTCALKAAEFLRPSFVPEGLEYKWEHSAN